jgi:hypothetical protein
LFAVYFRGGVEEGYGNKGMGRRVCEMWRGWEDARRGKDRKRNNNLVKIPSTTPEAERPKEGERVLCLHPFEEQKRVYVVPAKVEALHTVVWNGSVSVTFPPLPTFSLPSF